MNIANTTSVHDVFATVNTPARINSDMTETLGPTIKRLRKERGWTQEVLAEQVGRSQRWLSDVERGHTKMPKIKYLRTLEDAFGLRPGELVRAANYTNNEELARNMSEDQPKRATYGEVLASLALDIHWERDLGRYKGILAMFTAWLEEERELSKSESAQPS